LSSGRRSSESDFPKSEPVTPQARVQAELAVLEKRGSGRWVVVVFAGVVVILGALSLLVPFSFWQANSLQVTVSPGVVFIIMVAAVLIALMDLRHDMNHQWRRLASLQSLSKKGVSGIDALTHVLSRHTLGELLSREILRSERTNRPLALIMGGVNGLKQINEHYNPLMGDYVLSQMASILKECVRGCDYVVRSGRDEFLLLLPDTDAKGMECVRQRILEKVAEWDRRNRVGEIPVSISLGPYCHVNGQTPEKDVVETAIRMYAERQAAQRGATSPQPAPQGSER